MTRIYEETTDDASPSNLSNRKLRESQHRRPHPSTLLSSSTSSHSQYDTTQNEIPPKSSLQISNGVSRNGTESPDPSEISNNISIVSIQDDDDDSSSTTVSDSENESDNNETSTPDFKYAVEAVKNTALNASTIPQNGTVILTQALAEPASPPKIGNIAVQNSSDITFGNKTFYQGPVTIKQFLLNGDNRWVERSNSTSDSNQENGHENPSFTTSNDDIETKNPTANGMYEFS